MLKKPTEACSFSLEREYKRKEKTKGKRAANREHSAPFPPRLCSLGECNRVPMRLGSVHGEKMCTQACACVFQGRVTKLGEEMEDETRIGVSLEPNRLIG